MDTMTAENVAKPNVLIVNGANNVNRDLNCNEKLAELLSSDLNIEIDIELVKNTEKDVISWGKVGHWNSCQYLQGVKLTDMPRTVAKQKGKL